MPKRFLGTPSSSSASAPPHRGAVRENGDPRAARLSRGLSHLSHVASFVRTTIHGWRTFLVDSHAPYVALRVHPVFSRSVAPFARTAIHALRVSRVGCHISRVGGRSLPVGGRAHPVGFLSHPEGLFAYPVGNDAYPVGCRAYPVGCRDSPLGLHAYPLGNRSYPLGYHAYPLGNRAYPVGNRISPRIVPAPIVFLRPHPQRLTPLGYSLRAGRPSSGSASHQQSTA